LRVRRRFPLIDTRTKVGAAFLEYSSKGQLVPDEITVQLWKARIDAAVDAHSFKPDIDILVLDGIPRNVGQAKIMDELIDVEKVFHLSCPDRAALFGRLKKRALKDNRLDDANEDVIKRRLETYENESKPVLGYYGKERITCIDATQPPSKVLLHILESVNDGSNGNGSMSQQQQFENFTASSLYCDKCKTAMPVRERLLLVLPDKEVFDYLCTGCASSVGQREVTAGEKMMAQAMAPRRPRRAAPVPRLHI
jgi:adenylate kinase